jgi:4-hydroxybenzoate polyprenyltransferase
VNQEMPRISSLILPPFRRLVRSIGQPSKRLHTRFPKLPHFIALTRLNRPIGIGLLLWPTLWGLWMANGGWPGWHLFTVFTLGVILTRSAGCIANDLADRDLDGAVARTATRPLATGALEVSDALILMGTLLLIALTLVLTTNTLTLSLAVLAVIIAGTYPFMKRLTYMPQAVLGIAFAWGIPMAFAASVGEVTQLGWLLFVATAVWIVAYDTQYAMIDRDDDIRIGIKSTAILFGDMDRVMIGALQALFIICLLLVARITDAGWSYFAGVFAGGLLLLYQQYLIRRQSREGSFAAFLNNNWVGLAIFSGIAIDLF